ncbi:BMP-binding endothelial regulator protein-like [Pectinophora gossypiella]|uniref:BMP-binding endothelial regulator protein-like n=1 Tax=Pectinophora gossypiella TaxID=13191 RepID=UPI00214E2129|nr:BMP-binding endothelial regulator protein-like [Pectinophora gossypiella]
MRGPRAPAAACLLALAAALTHHAVLATTALKGERAPCTNEGEQYSLQDARLEHDWSSCFTCICKNGFVECRNGVEECGLMLEDCAVVLPREGCCARCKGCWYNGTEHASHSEWSDDGRLLRCEAGVVTISRPECYAPCPHPKHQRHTHYNCPVCDECVINGQRVWEGRDVRIPEEPCLSCRCVRGALSCAKRACPVLPCPINQQATPPGECCPRCTHPTSDKILPLSGIMMSKPCIIGKDYHAHGSPFRVDPCTDCTCLNGTAVCTRHTCPVLTCGARALPPAPGKCCPECPQVEEAKAACVIGGKTYQDGEAWQLDACKSCECHGGEPRCAMERCPILSCPPDQTLRQLAGQCCPKCVDIDGICTVFGDPHYKTFDGKFYSFQGSCKYQLVSDCENNTFSIRISNDARNTTHSSWTRTATLRIGPTKINMGKKMRIKVNSQRVMLPHKISGIAEITRSNGSVLLKADIGVQMLWDGDGFLEVTVSSVYKGKLCGLCGNFNSVARDDMKSRDGRQLNDPWRFGSSWRVGGKRACTRRQERPGMASRCRQSKMVKARRLCRGFERNEAFARCGAMMNPQNYREACLLDACSCMGTRCHCAAYRAYARECTRLGVEPQEWARSTWCEGPPPPWLRGRRPKHHSAEHEGAVLSFRDIPKPNGSRARPPPPILH